MAIYNVNKDTGDITETAGKYGSSNSVFYGTIAQWNALTTEQKKTYDHASIPDSLDGNVTFPASKVMMLDGASVEADLASAVPRTATGTTLAQLITAIGKLSEEQMNNCLVKIDFRRLRRITTNAFNFVTLSGTQVVEIKLDIGARTYKQYINNGDVTDLSITAWTLYYQGTPIS